MPFQKGQKRPEGAGKKKGSTNQRTKDFQAVLERHNFCPASAMIEIFTEAKKIYSNYAVIYEAIVQAKSSEQGYPAVVQDNAHTYLKIAGDMAKDLSSYSYAKRKSVETTVDQALLDTIKSMEGKTDAELLAILNIKK